MSIPPRKPLDPVDLSIHVSHKAHEGAVTERHPSEDDNAPPRSPYAPRQARAQPAVTSDFAARDDAGPLPPVRAPGGLRRDTERHDAVIRTLGDTRSEPLNIETKT
jgi:hypothetical protein